MKIYKISAMQTSQALQRKPITFKGNASSVNLPPYFPPNNSPLDTLGRSMVSIEDGFDKTIKNNYFKLKPGETPDEYQIAAAKSIFAGHDVLVTAPTGTGKTAIAEYAISKNMADGKRTFYTTPLKALSNQKLKELQGHFGEKNVGLLTGDIKINPDAPIVVMTTEIYRNMVFGDQFKNNSNNPKTVIFDELHYMGDVDRGGIWEQSIVLSDKNTQLLSLSATIGNNKEINNWVSKTRGVQGDLIDVAPEKRHVPLEEFKPEKIKQKPNKIFELTNLKLVKELREKGKLPAIFFVFNKKVSRNLVDYFKKAGLILNTKEQTKEVKKIIKEYEESGKYLGENLDFEALKKGYTVHNAGLLPTQKELVEELFQKKLLQLVLATETFAAGINMPARTVIITALRKPTDFKSADSLDGKRALTVNEFHQMTGRAGRRGIDEIGYFYALPKDEKEEKIIQSLIASPPDPIKSHFEPDYSFIANYFSQTQDEGVINKLLSKSFMAYDEIPEKAVQKTTLLLNKFKVKTNTLQNFGYLKPDKTITPKGEMLANLNGYQQMPIIDMIYNKNLASLNSVELAGCVGAMASTDEQVAQRERRMQLNNKDNLKNNVPEKFEHENSSFSGFINSFDEYLQGYNKKMSQESHFNRIAQDKDVAKRLYDWAYLNNNSSDSKTNWKTMCTKHIKEHTEEGDMFKEITQTVDLLKQMSRITDTGLKIATTPDGLAYFKDLKGTICESLNLLSVEPIPRVHGRL